MGSWFIQESKRYYKEHGKDYSFSELGELAEAAEPFRFLFDPDEPVFYNPGNMPKKIQKYCMEHYGEAPETVGEIIRCIYESLAMKYRMTKEMIEDCTGKKYTAIHMVGGGTQSALLCQLTADACKCPVYAGPIEATVYGNIAIQLMAEGVIGSLEEIRSVIKASEDIRRFEPQKPDEWESVYRKYREDIRNW